ncbi:class I SAM-dependent methyltransferase [Methanoplanus endosymbiosus]|uniref:class I SAM-dependent methyltransferase n=1 Tax=Methanoplanus endosymbiosus TaxID=33865 RepID=UPI0027E24034|nr:methyltransferase domain-containing protein [Methanoplanus endosymbiosus]
MSEHYDSVATVYDKHYDQSQGQIYYNHICENVMPNIPKGKKLLDLGCGTGLFMRRYIALGGEAVGLDISRGMVIKGIEKCSADFMTGNAEVLPFKDESFDAVTSLLAFSYLQNPEDMLEESFRILKPGGSISICTLGKNVFTTMVPVAYRIGEKLKIKRVGMAYFGEHYYREDELTALFDKIGFSDVRVERKSFAHVDLKPKMYSFTKKLEPFVEEKMPYLAFNICASGVKE